MSISGVITEFEGRNPHSYVHIKAVDENGKTQDYVCESHGVTQLTRNGVTPQILKVGSRIRVTGSLSRHSPYMCFFDSVELADGRVLSVNGPRGAGPGTAPSLAPRTDIFGTWLLAPAPNRSTSGPQPMIALLTPAGQKAVAAYDPFKDDPTFRCDPVAIRRVWGAPGTPLEIVRDGSDIVLRHEWMDVRRVIHMNMKTHPKNGTRGVARPLDRPHGGRHAGDRDGQLLGRRAQPVRRAAGPADARAAALRRAHHRRAAAPRRRASAAGPRSRPDRSRSSSRSRSRASTNEYAPSALKIEPFNCSREGVTGTIKAAQK